MSIIQQAETALRNIREAQEANRILQEKATPGTSDWLTYERIDNWLHEAITQIEGPANSTPAPKCACCETTENLHRDLGSGGPYRCDSSDCVVF